MQVQKPNRQVLGLSPVPALPDSGCPWRIAGILLNHAACWGMPWLVGCSQDASCKRYCLLIFCIYAPYLELWNPRVKCLLRQDVWFNILSLLLYKHSNAGPEAQQTSFGIEPLACTAWLWVLVTGSRDIIKSHSSWRYALICWMKPRCVLQIVFLLIFCIYAPYLQL